MAKKGNTPLNLSLPADLVDAARDHFASMGKGALSRRMEKELVSYLRRKGVVLPEKYLLKPSARV